MTARPQEVERCRAVIERHRRHVEESPGVDAMGAQIREYALAVCDDILADLPVALSAPPEGDVPSLPVYARALLERARTILDYPLGEYHHLCDDIDAYLSDPIGPRAPSLTPASPAPLAPLWQKCPVCDGQGLVNKPAHVAGDQATWTDAQAGPYPCRRCAGTGTIAAPVSPRAPEGLREALRVVGQQLRAIERNGWMGSGQTGMLSAMIMQVDNALASEPAPPEGA